MHGRRIFCSSVLCIIFCISDEAKYVASFSVILSLYIIVHLRFPYMMVPKAIGASGSILVVEILSASPLHPKV